MAGKTMGAAPARPRALSPTQRKEIPLKRNELTALAVVYSLIIAAGYSGPLLEKINWSWLKKTGRAARDGVNAFRRPQTGLCPQGKPSGSNRIPARLTG